ncbi:MAG: iron-sulfur cluster carrier protein ApbC [Gammaproteobacteria bacterium]|nr:iron-sulfur cluster carrier protein ApbC [Gammaproteobacteria bacterium]
MTNPDESQIRDILSAIHDPYLGQDLVSAGAYRGIDAGGAVSIVLGYPAAARIEPLKAEIDGALKAAGVQCPVSIDWEVTAHAVQGQLAPLAGIKNIIAVASGKGGVGKSTTAANLAVALAQAGATVGMLDADVYGPSQPRMLGISGKPESKDGKVMEPLENHGVKSMSIGYLVDEDQPMVWRGPMVTQALTQLLNETNWGELDYLVVDMPPGTGDTQLTMSQRVPLAGAVIVTTPQDIALLDARKGLQMFRKVNVNVLGIIENMSTHVCSNCGHEEAIFGKDGGQAMATTYETRYLGGLPLDIRIREQADSGTPSVAAEPDGDVAAAYREIALKMTAGLARDASGTAGAFPSISEDDS